MPKNKLYSILLIACFFGYIWLGFSIYNASHKAIPEFGVCLFKTITSVPCPSCGTTRSVELLIKGEVIQAIEMNPFGLIVAVLMFIIPIWIVLDCLFKTQTLWHFYNKAEKIIKIKWVAVALILLVLCNWIWNINKGL